jgi:hypothetical protein
MVKFSSEHIYHLSEWCILIEMVTIYHLSEHIYHLWERKGVCIVYRSANGDICVCTFINCRLTICTVYRKSRAACRLPKSGIGDGVSADSGVNMRGAGRPSRHGHRAISRGRLAWCVAWARARFLLVWMGLIRVRVRRGVA